MVPNYNSNQDYLFRQQQNNQYNQIIPSVVFIRNDAEMENYLLQPGNGIIFINESAGKLYKKFADAFGSVTIKSFKFIPEEPVENNNYVTWEDLNKVIASLQQPQVRSTIGRKTGELDES